MQKAQQVVARYVCAVVGLGVERTPHDGSDTRDEIDDLGFDAGIGASAERRVVRSGREIDWEVRSDMRFAGLYRLARVREGGFRTAREKTIFGEDSDGVDE